MRSDCSKEDIMASLMHKVSKTNKLTEKEAKKCQKYGHAIDIMFKGYQERASDF